LKRGESGDSRAEEKWSFNHETHEAHENPFGVHALACSLKVLRWEERDKRLVIKDAELVA